MSDFIFSAFGTHFLIPGYAQQLMLAAGLGLFIGIERAWRQKVASFRTFSFISTGSCLFTLLSVAAAAGHDGSPYDVTRVAAGIVTGIGFVGGGVIFKTDSRIEGITTGAMIWMAAAIGMSCGFNKINYALWGFAVYTVVMLFSHILHRMNARLRLFTRLRKRAKRDARIAAEAKKASAS